MSASKAGDRLVVGSLSVEARLDGDTLEVNWSGASESREAAAAIMNLPERWSSMLDGTRVVLDFTKLTFMNSATVASIVVLVKDLDRRAAQTQLIFDGNVAWQRVHLSCMRAIVRTLSRVSVESLGGDNAG
jgi:hypothetical protein